MRAATRAWRAVEPSPLTSRALDDEVPPRGDAASARVHKELHNLFEQRSSIAYLRASARFNALDGDVRNRVAAKANAVARQFHNPSTDVRRLFPDLFTTPTTEKMWK